MNKYQNQLIGIVYLCFATLGAILPTLANIKFVKEYGPTFNISLFINLANANPAAQSLSQDLLIGAVAVMTWVIIESRRLKMKNLWIVIISSLTISFAFATPLFLFLRERRLKEMQDE